MFWISLFVTCGLGVGGYFVTCFVVLLFVGFVFVYLILTVLICGLGVLHGCYLLCIQVGCLFGFAF